MYYSAVTFSLIELGANLIPEILSINCLLADNGLDRGFLKQYRKVVFYSQDLNGLRILILKNVPV